MCIRYANPSKLGEDCARAIYVHGAQQVDPASDATFWPTWHDFEVAHGNEDTFREMLRIKRAVRPYVQAVITQPRPAMRAREPDKATDDAPRPDSMAAPSRRTRRPAADGSGASKAARRGGMGADAAALASAAESFEGARAGFVFKMGSSGLATTAGDAAAAAPPASRRSLSTTGRRGRSRHTAGRRARCGLWSGRWRHGRA